MTDRDLIAEGLELHNDPHLCECAYCWECDHSDLWDYELQPHETLTAKLGERL